jgi:hypothetical protein
MAKPKKAPGPLSEAALVVLLREKFPAPEYAFMPQVRNGTGYTRTVRTADAVAMSLWPSRGLELYGFELKSARSDWLRERADPSKAEEIGKHCDRWWVVAGADSVIPEGDLFPPTWGLMVAREGKLVIVREAPKLDAQPLDRSQLAAIFRRAAECVVPRAEIKAALAREREEIDKTIEVGVESATAHLRRQLKDLVERVEEFERASGLEIRHGWDREPIAKAARFIADGGLEAQRAELEGLASRARAVATRIEEALAPAPRLVSTGTGGGA